MKVYVVVLQNLSNFQSFREVFATKQKAEGYIAGNLTGDPAMYDILEKEVEE